MRATTMTTSSAQAWAGQARSTRFARSTRIRTMSRRSGCRCRAAPPASAAGIDSRSPSAGRWGSGGREPPQAGRSIAATEGPGRRRDLRPRHAEARVQPAAHRLRAPCARAPSPRGRFAPGPPRLEDGRPAWSSGVICGEPGCPNVRPCRTHERVSSRNHRGIPRQARGLGADHDRRRRALLELGLECELRLPGCMGWATSPEHRVPRSQGGTGVAQGAACLHCQRVQGGQLAGAIR